MAVDDLTRRTFVKGSAAVGGGIALGGPISALGADAAHGKVKRVVGYGDLQPTPEQDTGEVYLDLPRGFRYRVISRDYEIMSDGNPTPGIFDGTGAYPGPRNTTVLIRNHENRSRPNEITVDVPVGRRYDPDVNVRGGNTKLVVDRNRRVVESFAVLGGTHTNCAGGVTPWNSWITCEEIFNYGAVENNVTPGTGVPHGYAFEVPSEATGPVSPVPITAAGRFAREAVAFLDGILYQTEDRGDAAFYRFVPGPHAARVGRPGDVRRHAAGPQGPQPAELRHGQRQPGRVVPGRVGHDRGAQPAHATRSACRRRRRARRSSTAPRASGRSTGACTSTARPAARPAPASSGS